MTRPSKTLWIVLVILLAAGLAYCLSPGVSDDRTLKLTVLDTKKNPVPHAKVKYQTLGTSSTPNGELETDKDGSVLWPVPKGHDVACTITCEGYAIILIRMDRASDRSPWHQTQVKWVFPSHDPKNSTPRLGGEVVPDVDDADVMQLSVYLPKERDKDIPAYGPHRVVHEENGRQVWTSVPSDVLKY